MIVWKNTYLLWAISTPKFNTSNNLLAYAGMYPNAQNYNKNLHKLLLRISHKLVRYNPVYDFVYTNAYNKYSSLNTNEEHIEDIKNSNSRDFRF